MHSDLTADPDTSSPRATTTLVDDLQPIVPLIVHVDLQDVALAEIDADCRLVAEEILQSARQLTSMTGWTEEKLLKSVGCEMETVGKFRGAEIDRLERCRDFMSLVTRNAGLVDTAADRRYIVVQSARLLKAIGGKASDLEQLQKVEVNGYTAIDYIRLGELDTASEQVRDIADPANLGKAGADDPYASTRDLHLSITRINMLLEGKRERLGFEVANYMQHHIDTCTGGCPDAVAACRSVLESPAE